MQTDLFELKKITFRVMDKTVFADKSIHLYKNQVNLVVGDNGSGKTTLLRLIKGIYTECSGQIIFNNRALLSNERFAKSEWAYMSAENSMFWPELSVHENLYAALSARGLTAEAISKKWQNECKMLLLDKIANKKMKFCSSGEQKLFKLAIHLTDDNKSIFLLDEPTHFLDAKKIESINKFVQHEMLPRGKSLIITAQKHLAGLIPATNVCELV